MPKAHIPHPLKYFLFISRPQARNIYLRAQEAPSEISGLPLWMIYVLEFIIRMGIFIFIAASIETLLTDRLFEKYKVDYLFGAIFLLNTLQSVSCAVYFDCEPKSRLKQFHYMHNFFYCIFACYLPVPILIRLHELSPHSLSTESLKLICATIISVFSLVCIFVTWLRNKKIQL